MRQLVFGAVTLALAGAAGPVQALSCMRPNLARTFNMLNTSEHVYVMALGRLEQTGAVIQRPTPRIQELEAIEGLVSGLGIPKEVPAKFTGQGIGIDGLSVQMQVEVTVDLTCAASWCGSFPATNAPMLVFLEQTEAGYRLTSGPCGGDFKIAPTPEDLELVQSCLSAGHCSDAQVEALDGFPN